MVRLVRWLYPTGGRSDKESGHPAKDNLSPYCTIATEKGNPGATAPPVLGLLSAAGCGLLPLRPPALAVHKNFIHQALRDEPAEPLDDAGPATRRRLDPDAHRRHRRGLPQPRPCLVQGPRPQVGFLPP